MEQEYGMLAAAGAPGSAPLGILAGPSFDWTEYGFPEHREHRRLLKRAVAALPCGAVAEMQRRELIFAIRTAELPWLDAETRLEFADRPTLERLVHLARRVCRRQLSRSPQPDGGAGREPLSALPHPFREQFDHDPPSPADPVEEPQWREKAR
jgi:hypothetical protein